MRKFYWLIICFGLLYCACANTRNPNVQNSNTTEITVSAAASLQDAFREIGALYEKQTGVKVNLNFAASGALQQQIEHGAPVDVFASAGQSQMNVLRDKQLLTDNDSSVNFAQNKIVLIVSSDANVKTGSFVELLENKTAKIAVGNPKTVPAGVYAEQTLRRLGVWDKFQPRLVFAEDVRQVLQYVERGETEAGIVYASDVSQANKKVREVARAPENSHEPIFYPIAVIKNSRNQVAAKKFIELVTSGQGQTILKTRGFQEVSQKP